MAGSIALLLSAKGGANMPLGEVLRVFQTTAKPVVVNNNANAAPQTVTQQGAGLINVYNAVQATTIVSPTELILEDTVHFQGS